MDKSHAYCSIALAGLLAAGGAQAQSSVTTFPQRAGEASTFVQGRPNMNPDSAMFAANRGDLSRDNARAELLSGRTVPPIPGQASTFVRGRPNMNRNSAIFAANRGNLSRDQVRQQLLARDDRYRAALEAHSMGNTGQSNGIGVAATPPLGSAMGNTGQSNGIGVPATLPLGSPSVFEGGTPK